MVYIEKLPYVSFFCVIYAFCLETFLVPFKMGATLTRKNLLAEEPQIRSKVNISLQELFPLKVYPFP